MKLGSYLTFNGNCLQAMLFYRECFGGHLEFQRLEDSPCGEKMPVEIKHYILHASLKKADLELIGSDMVPENGLVKGNSVSLVLKCYSPAELQICFQKLSVHGKNLRKPEASGNGGLVASLTDQFGTNWLLQCEFKYDDYKDSRDIQN